MLKFWENHGLLGINARNLLYIKPLNQKAQIAFADDKMRTKQYLSTRGVKSGRILGRISSESELLKFPWDSLPNDFVLKPNAGYGGEGILVVKQREERGWVTIKDEFFSREEMVEHVTDILDGRYSITNSPDSVFFEQRLVCHPEMGSLGQFGLPDIRVIVYNLVPVMAMVRVPTRESKGKANLHLGGLALGIDLAKGETTHMAHYDSIIKEHSDFGSLRGIKIPFWEQVLLQATQIQQLITLGYLAVDIVIDANMGPALLEINARAGLNVQLANLAPLRERLDRVAGVKVQTAEKGVRVAQDLFGNKIERSIQALSGKKVIGMEEECVLNLKHGTKTLVARMNPSVSKNYLETGLFRQFTHDPQAENVTLNYTLADERGKTVFFPMDMREVNYQVMLGSKALSNFFLDVTRTNETKKIPNIDMTTPVQSERSANDPWQRVDHQLADYDSKLGLVSYLRPLNLEEEKKRFFASKTYQPQFRYKEAPDVLIRLKADLENLSINTFSPLGKLFEGKRRELIQKADLIALIGDDRHFVQQAKKTLGFPPEEIVSRAVADLEQISHRTDEAPNVISSEAAVGRFEQFLKSQQIRNWQVKLKKGIVARCVVGKHNCLLVKEGERFTPEDIDKLVAHEIETHIYCTENGKLQPYYIFRRGTAGYLKTQEGLAIYHQSRVVDEGARGALIGFHAVLKGGELGFRGLYEWATHYLDSEQAWMMAVKVKRGLQDSSLPGAFPKNALYYWGYLEVKDYVDQGGKWEDLFLGKFELSQLPLIRNIPGIVEAKYLPSE